MLFSNTNIFGGGILFTLNCSLQYLDISFSLSFKNDILALSNHMVQRAKQVLLVGLNVIVKWKTFMLVSNLKFRLGITL